MKKYTTKERISAAGSLIACIAICTGLFIRYGFTIDALLLCLAATALILIAVVDARTFIIPDRYCAALALIAVIRMITGNISIKESFIGAILCGGFLLLLYEISKGRVMGGGDVKLVAAMGLLLGAKLTIVGFVWGCIIGTVIHLFRMRFEGAGRELAMGPYLAAGFSLAMIMGDIYVKAALY